MSDRAASAPELDSADLTGAHAGAIVADLLAHIDEVAASAELQSSTVPGGSPTLGLGLVALLLSEQWRPKRTETVSMRRIDWAETRLACELDVSEAMALTTATRLGDDVWLPLFRLQAGVTPPSVVVDDKGARLPVMSSGECASHIAAGLAQVLGASVFREAFSSHTANGGVDWLDNQRRRTSVNFLLREAVLRILLENWNRADPESDGDVEFGDEKDVGCSEPPRLFCSSCTADPEPVQETRRAYGLSRLLLHNAAHRWLVETERTSTANLHAVAGLGGRERNVVPGPVLDTGLGTLAVVSTGPLIAALVPRQQRRVTLEAQLPPRWFRPTEKEDADDWDATAPASSGRTTLSELIREQFVPAVVPCAVELRGLRLYQTVEVQVEVEDGLTISPDSDLRVTLEASKLRQLRAITNAGQPVPQVVDVPETDDPAGPHPRPEFALAVENLEALMAADGSAGDVPGIVGQRALLNRVGAHASQMADVLSVSDVPTRGEQSLSVVSELRTLAGECHTWAESAPSLRRDVLEELIRRARAAVDAIPTDPRQISFRDSDNRTGVFRREIGPFDIPDRFIRPLKADGNFTLEIDDTLAEALRRQVAVVTTGIALLLAGAVALMPFRPSADALASVLLLIPAALVVSQRIESAPTIRARLERAYRNWQLVALMPAGLLALATAGLGGSTSERRTVALFAVALCMAVVAVIVAWWAARVLRPHRDFVKSPRWRVSPSTVTAEVAARRLIEEQFEPIDRRAMARRSAPLALTAFEPAIPHFDELRQIGHTAGDAAGRLQRAGFNVVAVRGGELGSDGVHGALRLCRSGTITPTSVFMARFGYEVYEFVSGLADRELPTREQLGRKLKSAIPLAAGQVLFLRTLASASDAPIFGAGQLSESWIEWPTRRNPSSPSVEPVGEAAFSGSAVEILRDVAALSAAYQGPLSYFHLMSWENGHLFTRVGAFLSQRGHRDEVRFEGQVAAVVQHNREPNSGVSLSFVAPTFTASSSAEGHPSALRDSEDRPIFDLVISTDAAAGTSHQLLTAISPLADVLNATMTVLDGTEAIVLRLQLQAKASIGAVRKAAAAVFGAESESDFGHINLVPRDVIDADRDRYTLWVSWSGSCQHADPVWVTQAVGHWSAEVTCFWPDEVRPRDIRVDYLVTRLRRGSQQVGRARISFRADVENFRQWEATLRKVAEARQGRSDDDQWAAPVAMRVDVQHFEPRSSSYRAVRFGGRVEPIASPVSYPGARGLSVGD